MRKEAPLYVSLNRLSAALFNASNGAQKEITNATYLQKPSHPNPPPFGLSRLLFTFCTTPESDGVSPDDPFSGLSRCAYYIRGLGRAGSTSSSGNPKNPPNL